MSGFKKKIIALLMSLAMLMSSATFVYAATPENINDYLRVYKGEDSVEVSNVNRSDVYLVKITGLPSSYYSENTELSFGTSKTSSTDAQELSDNYAYMGGMKHVGNGVFKLKNEKDDLFFRKGRISPAGQYRFMVWLDDDKLGYSDVFTLSAPDFDDSFGVTNICYEKQGDKYNFSIHSNETGYIEQLSKDDSGSDVPYDSFVRIYTAESADSLESDITDLFYVNQDGRLVDILAKDARGVSRVSMYHNIGLGCKTGITAGSEKAAYLDINLAPSIIDNANGVSFSIHTKDTTNVRANISKVEVYIKGQLARSVTVSDSKPAGGTVTPPTPPVPVERKYHPQINVENANASYTAGGRFKNDVVVSVGVYDQQNTLARDYNGSAKLTLSSDGAFILNGSGAGATSHEATIAIENGVGSYRVISATAEGEDKILAQGTAFGVNAVLTEKEGLKYENNTADGSFNISGLYGYRKYEMKFDCENGADLANANIDITIDEDEETYGYRVAADENGAFSFYAPEGIDWISQMHIVPQEGTGFYIYNVLVGNTLTNVKIKNVHIPLDFKWYKGYNAAEEAFSNEELEAVKFFVVEGYRECDTELDAANKRLVVKNVEGNVSKLRVDCQIPNESVRRANLNIKTNNTTDPVSVSIINKRSVKTAFADGIDRDKYFVSIYKHNEEDGGYNFVSYDTYSSSSVEDKEGYRVIFSKMKPNSYLNEEYFNRIKDNVYYEDFDLGYGETKAVTLNEDIADSADNFDVSISSRAGVYTKGDDQNLRYFSLVIYDKNTALTGRKLKLQLPEGYSVMPDEDGNLTMEISSGMARQKIGLTYEETNVYVSDAVPRIEGPKIHGVSISLSVSDDESKAGTMGVYVDTQPNDTLLGTVSFEDISSVSIIAPLMMYGNTLYYSLYAESGSNLHGNRIKIYEEDNKFEPFYITWYGGGTVYPPRLLMFNPDGSGKITQSLTWTGEEPENGESLTLCVKRDLENAPVSKLRVRYLETESNGELIEYLMMGSEISSITGEIINGKGYIISKEKKDAYKHQYVTLLDDKAAFEAKINEEALPEGKEIYTLAVVINCTDGRDIISFLEPKNEDKTIWQGELKGADIGRAGRYNLAYSYRPKVENSEETEIPTEFEYTYEQIVETINKYGEDFGKYMISLQPVSGEVDGYNYTGYNTTMNLVGIGETVVTTAENIAYVNGEDFFTGDNVYTTKVSYENGEEITVKTKTEVYRYDGNEEEMVKLTYENIEDIEEFYSNITKDTEFVYYSFSIGVDEDGNYFSLDENESNASSRRLRIGSTRDMVPGETAIRRNVPRRAAQGTPYESNAEGKQNFREKAVQTAVSVKAGDVLDVVSSKTNTAAGVASGAISGLGHSLEYGPIVDDIKCCIARARNVLEKFGPYLTEEEIAQLNEDIGVMEYSLGVVKGGFAGAIAMDAIGTGAGLGSAALAIPTAGGSVAVGAAVNGNIMLASFGSERVVKNNYNRVLTRDARVMNLLKTASKRKSDKANEISVDDVLNLLLYQEWYADTDMANEDFGFGINLDKIYDGGIGHGGGGGNQGGGTVPQDYALRLKVDPQGNVYDQNGNPVKGATMTVYFSENADGSGAIAWVNKGEKGDAGDAAYAEILRPDWWDEPGIQETDELGFYSWNVPDGYYYQVVAEKAGYITAKSEWLRVLPPRFGVDLVLVSKNQGGGGGGGGGGGASASSLISAEDNILNGKLTVSPENAKKGAEVIITASPDEGYILKSLKVQGPKGEEIQTKALGNDKFSFIMPGFEVKVSAEFVEKKDSTPNTPLANPFIDVKESDWFYEDVMYMYSNGIMSGTGEKTFDPMVKVNRAMIVTVIWRNEGEPTANNPKPFEDVPTGQWYSQAIAWAYEKGIANGYGDGTFNPEGYVTREELAAFMYAYAKYKGYDLNAGVDIDALYNDGSEVSAWAKTAVSWAVGSKLISGKGNGIIDPKGYATRAELAAIFHRFSVK